MVPPFTEQARASINIPLTREAAANTILAFFNAHQDPLDRINLVVDYRREGARAEAGRILTTYYLCCIKYLTDIDMLKELEGDTKCEAMVDDTLLVRSKKRHTYLGLKAEKRKIPKELVAFHAVYGAYVMCRPVATKRNFREWVGKRYSSFLASIQYAPEMNVNLALQNGGTQVNEVVVERASIRKIVYKITKLTPDNIVLSAIKNHISFLTSLSGMTTFSLIQQVIVQGGMIILIAPLTKQIAKYAAERAEVDKMMDEADIPQADIVYLRLIKPHYQCFRSSDYPDLVKTAQIIDQMAHPNNKTLDHYKGKTKGATCDETQIKQFLRAQNSVFTLKVDTENKEKIRVLLKESTDSMYEEAQNILDLLNKQFRNGAL